MVNGCRVGHRGSVMRQYCIAQLFNIHKFQFSLGQGQVRSSESSSSALTQRRSPEVDRSSCSFRPCPLKRARLHWAGVECRNYSPRGDGSGENGDALEGFSAWATCRRAVQEPVIILECSDRFPDDLLESILGDLYHIQGQVLKAVDVGAPGHRNRYWAICLHKLNIVETYCQLSNIWPVFKRTFVGGFKELRS